MHTICNVVEGDLWDLAENGQSERNGELTRHVRGCPSCQARLADMKRLCSGLEAIGRSKPVIPEHIGPYRILGMIGEGGMGIVYEAQQAEPPRRVALKVLRPQSVVNERMLRAFRREVRALARLDHPDIATIYDAGRTDDGQAYLSMQLIQGQPLDRYCDRQSLTLRERVALMARIAGAIHHAHERGILHRDLKPQNVLVDAEGDPHILDFGLARPLQTDEGTQAPLSLSLSFRVAVGTLAFMSPEQARGDDVDARSDVYSLGVVLYGLLTGIAPYEVPSRPEHAVRVIAETLPRHPSRVGSVPWELGDVVMKALEKDRGRRYGSAEALAGDLEGYLSGAAVSARPPSLGYQLRVFARHHKAAVAATAGVFLALVAGIVGIGLALARAERERFEAELVTRLTNEAMGIADPFETPVGIPTTLDSMNRLAELLETEGQFGPDSLHEARLRAGLGLSLHNIGEVERAREVYAVAEPHLRIAFDIRKRVLGFSHPDTLQSAHDLSLNLWRQGRRDEALPVERQAIDAWRASGTEATLAVAAILRDLGVSHLLSGGNYEAAEPLIRESERMAAGFPPSDQRNVVWSFAWNQLAEVANQQLEARKAVAAHRKALEIRRELRPYHPHLFYSLVNLKGATARFADPENQKEALDLQREDVEYSLARGEFAVGKRVDWARLLWRQTGDPTLVPPLFEEIGAHSVSPFGVLRARVATREALRASGQIADVEHWDAGWTDSIDDALGEKPTAGDATALAGSLLDFAALWLPTDARLNEVPSAAAQARPLARSALAILRDAGATPSPSVAEYLSLCGEDSLAREAARLLLESRIRILGEDHGLTLSAMSLLAEYERRAGRVAAAEDLARDARERSEYRHGPRSAITARVMQITGSILCDRGDCEERERMLRMTLEIFREKMGEDHLRFALAQRDLGEVLRHQGRFSEAESELRQALATLTAVHGPYHWETARARSELGACLLELDRLEEGASELGLAWRSFKHVLGDGHRWTKLAAERLASTQR